MTVPKMVSVNGLPLMVPQIAAYNFETIDIEDTLDANGHHEGRSDFTCDKEDGLFANRFAQNDQFNPTFERTKDGYRVTIDISSESKVGIWRNSRITMSYSEASKHWTMAARHDNKDWGFCSKEDVFQRIIQGFDCLYKTAPDDSVLQNLAYTFRLFFILDQESILASAQSYTERSDCEQTPKMNDKYATMTW